MTTHDPLVLIEHRPASVDESHVDLRDAIKDLTSAIQIQTKVDAAL